MAYGNFVLDKGYDAAAALTKFRAVKMTSTAEQVTPVTAVTDFPLGLPQFSVSAAELLKGKGASVREMGISEMEVGAAVARGAEVEIDSSGRAITASGTAGRWVLGVALEAGGTSGDRIPVLISRRKQ